MKDKLLQKNWAAKAVILFLLVTTAGIGKMVGQETLTINEPDEYSYNQETSLYAPFYGQFDSQQPIYSQFIIPASDLASLQYGDIQSLTFYISKDPYGYGFSEMPNWDFGIDQFEIYFAEVDNESFPHNDNWEYELFDENSMTMVFDYSMYNYFEILEDETYYQLTFYLNESGFDETGAWTHYLYNGGNLLVYIKPVQIYNTYDYECFWSGIGQYGEEGPCVIYTDFYDGYTYVYADDYFRPMITIGYTGGEAPSCPAPQDFEATPHAHYAMLNWTTDASKVNIQYKKSSDWNWTTEVENLEGYSSYDLMGLTSQTEYEVRIQAVCSEKNSDWSTITFTTTPPTIPTHFTASNYDTPEATTAKLNWWVDYNDIPAYWDIAYTTDMSLSPDNSDIITISSSNYYSSYNMTGLTPFATYKVWIRSNYGEGEVSEWSEPCRFKPTNWESLEVNRGYSSYSVVPFYISQRYSTTSRSQFIVTSVQLTDFTSREMTKLEFAPLNSFYGDKTGLPTATVQIYLKEVTETEFASAEYYDWDEMSLVYQGSFSSAQTQLEFDVPYYYSGGNLVVGVCATTEYNSSTYYYYNGWYGKQANNMTLYSIGTGDPSKTNFLPTTTFYFAPTETSSFTKEIAGYGESTGGYYLIASPIASVVTPTTDNGFLTNVYDLYYFDQSQNLEWRNFENTNFNLFNGTGYLYASQNDTELTFTGVPYNGDGVVELDYDADAHFAGWNLIGNPFSSAANINMPFYRLNATGDALNAFTEDGAVNVMEGVFVVATEAGQTATFTANNNSKGVPSLALNLSNVGNVVDRAIIRFDKGQQLPKFQLRANSTKVYVQQNDKDYAIVNAEAAGEVPVSFNAEKNGSYTISFNAENVEMTYLHLIDNLTGNDIDLLSTPYYTFDAKTTDYASRFKVVFAHGSSTSEDNFAFMRDNHLLVLGNEGQASLQVIDMTGRVLFTKTFCGNYDCPVDMQSGVYILKLVNGNNVRTQKIIIK